MIGRYCAILLGLVVLGCGILEPAMQPDGTPFPQRIDEPVEIQVPGQDAVVSVSPGGGVSLRVESGSELNLTAPIAFPVTGFPGYQILVSPDGSVEVTGPPAPPAQPRETTVADVAIDASAPLIEAGAAAAGNPMVGVLAVGALRALVGVFSRRRRTSS